MKTLMKVPSKNTAVTAMTLLVASSGWADMVDISGLQPWESCAFCHGLDGVSASPRFPHLAGQKPEYLQRQLQAFQRGQRNNDGGVMQTMAEPLTVPEISLLADYFADRQLTGQSMVAQANESAITDWVQTLYYNGLADRQIPACESCHGQDGLPQAPRLKGQHEAYLAKQLDEFASRRRVDSVFGDAGLKATGVGPGSVSMNQIAHHLSSRERRQLAAGLANWNQEAGNAETFLH